MGKIFSLTLFVILFSFGLTFGQSEKYHESELAFLADVMVNAQNAGHRKKAFDRFYPLFVEAINQENSFDFPFDSLIWISKQQPENKRFRIFTGIIDAGREFIHFGVLQMANGQVFELKDRFASTDDWEFSISDEKEWLGALYYDLKVDENKEGEHYLLFGLHKFTPSENGKLVDVLSFDPQGKPVFGKEIFRREYPDSRDIIKTRIILKYDQSSYVGLHFNPSLNMIVHDHLIPGKTPDNLLGMALISDGSLVGYEKKGQHWNYIDKIYTQVLDEAPRPQPVLDKRSRNLFGNEGKNK